MRTGRMGRSGDETDLIPTLEYATPVAPVRPRRLWLACLGAPLIGAGVGVTISGILVACEIRNDPAIAIGVGSGLLSCGLVLFLTFLMARR